MPSIKMIRKIQFVVQRNLGMVTNQLKETMYEVMPKDSLEINMLKNPLQASHCMLYAKNRKIIKLDDAEYTIKANILMHLRYDGCIGFPGGYVDEGENAEEAVVREINEEIAPDKDGFSINAEDHVISHYSREKNLIVHLFAKEVSLSLFEKLEQCSLKGRDYGIEVMGLLRVPLYTMTDNFGGFPLFSHNQFIGNTKQQLCYALVSREIMTEDEVNLAMSPMSLIN